MQLIPGLNNTVSIITVNDKNKALCILEVMSPQRTDLGKKDKRRKLQQVAKQNVIYLIWTWRKHDHHLR